MIIGVGIDIVEVERIRAALENARTGARFRARVFTPDEIAYCSRRRNAHESYAARFAAKEAMMKALGRAFGWREIEVARETGPPAVRLRGRALARAQAVGIRRINLSLSHTAQLAVAYLIAEGDGGAAR
ncbi:MAG: holo-ACP synthase [Candidatus Binatia bacterium]